MKMANSKALTLGVVAVVVLAGTTLPALAGNCCRGGGAQKEGCCEGAKGSNAEHGDKATKSEAENKSDAKVAEQPKEGSTEKSGKEASK
ncbi:MAG TPA: hypothetical protein V6D17_21675 [Candidatus Obscuribacterales bacterium]